MPPRVSLLGFLNPAFCSRTRRLLPSKGPCFFLCFGAFFDEAISVNRSRLSARSIRRPATRNCQLLMGHGAASLKHVPKRQIDTVTAVGSFITGCHYGIATVQINARDDVMLRLDLVGCKWVVPLLWSPSSQARKSLKASAFMGATTACITQTGKKWKKKLRPGVETM